MTEESERSQALDWVGLVHMQNAMRGECMCHEQDVFGRVNRGF